MGAAGNYNLLIMIVLAYSGIALCGPDEPAVYFPSFELRAVRPRGYLNAVSPHILSPQPVHFSPPRAVEADLVNPTSVPEQSATPAPDSEHQEVSKNDSVSVHSLLKALGISEEEKKAKEQERAATGRDYEYPSYPQPPAEYGYPSTGYWAPGPVYQDASYAYVPPNIVHHSPPSAPKILFPNIKVKASDESSLDKPATSKLTNKVSGLIGLVLALLTGSSSDDLEIKGVKDLVINGIVKPLLLAKGGIKSLISKLSIPLIVLLLMNLEVLVLIWWLWEDCQPAPVQHPTVPAIYPYSRPTSSYGFNPYR